jgi:hypothetical protein
VHTYYNAITKWLKKLADYEINLNMALVSFFMCAKTDEEARARAHELLLTLAFHAKQDARKGSAAPIRPFPVG